MHSNLSQHKNMKQEGEMINIVEVWEKILSNMKGEVQNTSFSTWFKGTHIVKINDKEGNCGHRSP